MKKNDIEEFKKRTNIGDLVNVSYTGGFSIIGSKENQKGYLKSIDDYKIILSPQSILTDQYQYPIFLDTILNYEILEKKALLSKNLQIK